MHLASYWSISPQLSQPPSIFTIPADGFFQGAFGKYETEFTAASLIQIAQDQEEWVDITLPALVIYPLAKWLTNGLGPLSLSSLTGNYNHFSDCFTDGITHLSRIGLIHVETIQRSGTNPVIHPLESFITCPQLEPFRQNASE